MRYPFASMKLIDALETGACGVMFTVPEGVTVRASEQQAVAYVDETRGLQWLVHFGDLALDLDPAHDALLASDVEAAARAIYRGTERMLDERSGAEGGRRSDDLEWSPVVSCARTAVGNGPALRVIHRSAYRPGCELIMGHLLVPTTHGVVELRVTAHDSTTGMRESVLLAKEFHGGRTRTEELPRQSFYDDPAHDAVFSKHCLSRVRAALDELQEPGRVEVVRPPITRHEGVVTLQGFGASFAPPPRFALVGDGERDVALLTRVSLANTDGVWRMAVAREDPDAISTRRTLRQRIETLLAARFGVVDLTAARVELAHADDGSARVHVRLAPSEAVSALASTWWLHPDGGLRGVQVSAPAGASLGDTVAVVDAAVSTWTLSNEAPSN